MAEKMIINTTRTPNTKRKKKRRFSSDVNREAEQDTPTVKNKHTNNSPRNSKIRKLSKEDINSNVEFKRDRDRNRNKHLPQPVRKNINRDSSEEESDVGSDENPEVETSHEDESDMSDNTSSKTNSKSRSSNSSKSKSKNEIPMGSNVDVDTRTCQQKQQDNFLYGQENSKLLTILIVVFVLIAIVLLVIFKCFTETVVKDGQLNNLIGGYLSLVGIPVGVTLAFVVTTVWTSYTVAESQLAEEATEVLSLYNIIGNYPGGDGLPIQQQIINYTEFIINDEFILMSEGIQSTVAFNMLQAIGESIYELDPVTPKQKSIYDQSIDVYQKILALRISRMGYVSRGLPLELWWVLLLCIIIVLVMTYFLHFDTLWYHILLTAFSVAALTALVFLIVSLDFPYKGDFGLSSQVFQIALSKMIESQ